MYFADVRKLVVLWEKGRLFTGEISYRAEVCSGRDDRQADPIIGLDNHLARDGIYDII